MQSLPVNPSRSTGLRVLALADHMGHRNGKVHGGTTYFVSVYPALVAAGVDLTVAFLSPPHPAADRLRAAGIEPRFFSRARWDPRALTDVRSLVRKQSIDVLHVASFRSHFFGRLIGHRAGKRCMVHLHDTVPLHPMMRFLQQRVVDPGDLAVAVSGPVGELGVRDYGFSPDRVRVLHNAIDIDFYGRPRPAARKALCAEMGLDPNHKLVAIIGRLDEMKGHRYAIQAMPALLNKCPDARLIVVGQGQLEEPLKELAVSLGVAGQVLFVGQRQDVPDILAAMDALVMPSISGEGLPFVAIEAIASGLPIVAYPTAGIPEVVVDGCCGLLVEHGQVDPLAEALARVLGDTELRQRLSDGARQHSRNFTLNRHVEQLVSMYQELAR